jgi:hypothetical protein
MLFEAVVVPQVIRLARLTLAAAVGPRGHHAVTFNALISDVGGGNAFFTDNNFFLGVVAVVVVVGSGNAGHGEQSDNQQQFHDLHWGTPSFVIKVLGRKMATRHAGEAAELST